MAELVAIMSFLQEWKECLSVIGGLILAVGVLYLRIDRLGTHMEISFKRNDDKHAEIDARVGAVMGDLRDHCNTSVPILQRHDREIAAIDARVSIVDELVKSR